MSKRESNDWMLTYTGRQLWPLCVEAGDVFLEDIAHALSQVCRFGGHTLVPYYVAQHSMIVANNVTNRLRKVAILHDATEYALGDMVAPLKRSIPQYRKAEAKVWSAVCERFDLDKSLLPLVKTADLRALVTERRDVMRQSNFKWAPYLEGLKPFAAKIVPMSSAVAEAEFLNYCARIGLK